MTSNIEGLIREGVAALKDGRKDEALALLTRATELDEHSEEAWLWLSAVVDSVENQQICLENVLAINPSNTRALQGLEVIKKNLGTRPSTPEVPPAVSGPQVSSDRVAASPGFHGSGRDVNLPSEAEYDAWVDGLNLGTDDFGAPPGVPGASDDAFGFDGGPFQDQFDVTERVDDSRYGSYDEGFDSSGYGDMMSPGQEGHSPQSGQSFDSFAAPQADSYGSVYDDTYAAQDDFDEIAGLDSGESGTFTNADPFSLGADSAEMRSEAELKRYLDYIPADIKPTYLPGEAPHYPRSTLFGLAVVSTGIVIALIAMIILLLG